MNTFYSILYVPIRPALDEKVSIALFIRQGEKVMFHYSPNKLNIIKHLIPNEAFNLLKMSLKNMNQYLQDIERKFDSNKLTLNDKDSIQFIGENYFSYLSKYSNNLLTYSEPKSIDVELSEQIYTKLFEKYIFEMDLPVQKEKKVTVHQRVRANLFPKIKEHVNVDRHLTSHEIPNLFAPTDVDFIGRNDVPVVGHSFDFQKRAYDLNNHIARFVSLTTAFELKNKKAGKFYVIGVEPSKKNLPEQHASWKVIHESKLLEFVPVNELDRIDAYMKTHDVKPYFEDLEV